MLQLDVKDWQQWQQRLIYIYDRPVQHHAANQKSYQDPHYATWFIRKGSVQINCSAGEFIAKQGNWVMVDAGYQRDQLFSRDAHIISICCSFDWQGMPTFAPPGPPIIFHHKSAPKLLPAAEKLCAFYSPKLDINAKRNLVEHYELQSHYAHWLSLWFARRDALNRGLTPLRFRDPRLPHIMRILQAHPHTGPCPYDVMRQEIALSRSQIDRIFHAAMGTSIQNWRTRKCQLRAEGLLKDPAQSIKAIAYELGFVDASHFSKWFKRHYRMAPSTWRQLGGQVA